MPCNLQLYQSMNFLIKHKHLVSQSNQEVQARGLESKYICRIPKCFHDPQDLSSEVIGDRLSGSWK
jgi:hypothetical protein